MKVFQGLWIIPILAFGGCVSPNIYIQSKLETETAIDKTCKIVIYTPGEESEEVRAFHSLLGAEMQDMGFVLAPYETADYFLFADFEEEIQGIPGRPLMPADPYATIPPGRWSIPGAINAEEALPYVKRYKVLIIRLSLCDLRLYKERQEVVPLWQGTIEAEENDFRKNRTACVRALLTRFGTDFGGYVRLE